MASGESFGYIASALVFATFYMRTMLPLRIVAIASNVAFITYAAIDGLTPILILHGALLPLNLLRLLQIRDLTVQVEKAATHEFSARAILPFMRRRNLRASETLFSANDVAEELYYIVEGELFIPELQQAVGPGSFLGEIALFSSSGRRTATAIASTDCTVMSLGKKAVFAALLHSPQLGIHLLRVITVRMLENAGNRDQQLIPAEASGPTREPDGLLDRFGRKTTIAALVMLGLIPVVVAIYQPLYIVLDRDAAVTSWLNEATAPIAGTIEGFETRIGQQVDQTGVVATLADRSADRSGVIKAESHERRAEARLAQVKQYQDKVTRLAKEWSERRARYADGFRRDLDLDVQDLEHGLSLLKERVELAEASARRRRSLRVTGTASQADEDVATSSHRELQVSLTQMEKALERVRERRRLADQGVFLQQDGKVPEWSWRSIDEIELEAARANRAVSDAEEELNTAGSTLAEERKNLRMVSTASIHVPPSMTIWSTAIGNNSAVKQGDRLFSWIDCRVLLVDVPVTETLAALLREGMRATVLLDGDPTSYGATVLQTRGASSRIGRSELAGVSPGHKNWTAQALVSIKAGEASLQCPIGRRAFVSFPDIRLVQYLRAYMPGW
ncbi:cyclic nucleotide-binding domain-containing protein [Reyranella soli]|nr:cyclic nucleotide-binding domain-containing protein [Reyranella soli]